VVVVFILGCVLAAGVGADTGAELVGVSGRGSPSAEVTATDWQGAGSRQQAASRPVSPCRRVAVGQWPRRCRDQKTAALGEPKERR
jgi:hypothetical protein